MEKRWIWPFVLEDKLGEGGMGVVYRGKYVKNDHPVAVKLVPADVTDEKVLARFERELLVLKTLKHPNIVRCFGGVCEDKQRFYAMELIEGGTLQALLNKKGRFPWQKVVAYGVQMCSALSYAHERGIVHRDVKPGNFLLDNKGSLKLSDFGLAGLFAARQITDTGKTMGTIRYMAPEQIRGQPPASPQTDLYALGCVLFELLTGRTPFDGNSAGEILQQHLSNQPPPVSAFTTGCPVALEHLVDELLAKDSTERPVSAAAVGRRLKHTDGSAIAETTTIHRTDSTWDAVDSVTPSVNDSPKTASSSWGRLFLGGVAALVLAFLLGWNLLLRQEARLATHYEALWIQAYRSENVSVQEEARQALESAASDSNRALTALIGALSHQESEVRSSAVATLRDLGAGAKPALPTLVRLGNSETGITLREEVQKAIEEISRAESSRSSWPLVVAAAIVTVVLICG